MKMVLIICLINLIAIILAAIFLSLILKTSPKQRGINDEEQMQWIKEFNQQRIQEKKT
jgi:hypothetical protein